MTALYSTIHQKVQRHAEARKNPRCFVVAENDEGSGR